MIGKLAQRKELAILTKINIGFPTKANQACNARKLNTGSRHLGPAGFRTGAFGWLGLQ